MHGYIITVLDVNNIYVYMIILINIYIYIYILIMSIYYINTFVGI